MLCKEPDCESPVKLKEMCRRHYQQHRLRDEGNRKKNADRQRAYMAADPARRAAHAVYLRQRKTGFTPELVTLLRFCQGGLCDICSVPLVLGGKGPACECADHCHDTATPRGLLCTTCNKSLGLYELRQRPRGFRLAEYEAYLARPPVLRYQAWSLVSPVQYPPPIRTSETWPLEKTETR